MTFGDRYLSSRGGIDPMRREEIERAANGLLVHFGNGALGIAQKRAASCKDRDDDTGAAHWQRVMAALHRKSPMEPAQQRAARPGA
jgi:hypothetical protein